jgi:nitrite reductase/ring-hydroxylating ferredoxin subunit
MNGAKLTKLQVDAILKEGAYYCLDDYALRAEILEKINAAFLDGIARLAGAASRDGVAADGLRQLHRHFPIAKIHLLEAHLMRVLRDELYFWSFRVGADTFGLPDPFYVDHLIVLRIHYPFLLARSARDIEPPPVLWGERMRLAYAALHDWPALRDYVAKRRDSTRPPTAKASQHNAFAYHGQIPVPARSHGPHIDTWYGHSYDGINLWLSIDGVNVDNTVILYPELFGRPLTFDPVSMYIARGVELPKPYKVELEPGQLLAFNPETLHGTQVNISDETRVALTTRINPAQPRFGPDASSYMEHWYCSEDLRRRKFSAVRRFSSAEHQGKPSFVERERYQGNRTIRMAKSERIEQTTPVAVCPADALRPGAKLAVDFPNAKLLLWRAGNELRAFSRTCPHLGIDIADGYHDETQVFCPGHGIAFALADGRSRCEAFKLRQFEAYEQDGMIYVARMGNVADESKPEAATDRRAIEQS